MATLNNLDTADAVEKYRKEINEACDARLKEIAADRKMEDLCNRPFGYIKESFEALAPTLFTLPNGKKIIAKYTKTIKENKSLSSLHSLYESVRKANKDIDVDFFINELTSESSKYGSKSISEDCHKLGAVLVEAYKTIGEYADSLLPSMDEQFESAMSFIAENKKTGKNLVEYSKSVKTIKEHILNQSAEDCKPSTVKNIDEYVNGLMEDFMSTYNDKLNEEEMTAISEISESKNKAEVFEKYKAECLNKLSEAKDTFINEGKRETAEKISSIMEQVSSKSFSEASLGIDIYNLLGIKNSI